MNEPSGRILKKKKKERNEKKRHLACAPSPGWQESEENSSVALNSEEPAVGDPVRGGERGGVWLNTVCTVQHGRDVPGNNHAICPNADNLVTSLLTTRACVWVLLLPRRAVACACKAPPRSQQLLRALAK